MKDDYLDPAKYPKMTSAEAAAMYLSDGMTKDIQKAKLIDANRANELNMDKLAKAGAARAMGFDFELSFYPRTVLVTTKQKPYLRTRAKMYPGDVDMETCTLNNEDAFESVMEAMARLRHKVKLATRTT